MWRLDGPEGPREIRVTGNMRSNSAEFTRSGLIQGLGIALRATWDIGSEIESGELKVVLPQYAGSSKNAIYAVYPCREFMPAKVNAFIDFYAEIFEKDAAWTKVTGAAAVARAASKTAAGKAA